MRQQVTNTFNEGINFDLNPITTPNNVLTDAINASFVTFNGDELALQNDAGNTKIQITSVKENNLYWTLSSLENISTTFSWNKIVNINNDSYSITTDPISGFNFLYFAIPDGANIKIYNQLNILLLDTSNPSDQDIFHINGTTTFNNFLYNVYRKDDVFNTSNSVLFRVEISNLTTQLVEYVTLSDGFLPLGIKENGGVLYIISGKLPNVETVLWDSNTSYSKDAIVYYEVFEKIFYKSLVNNNSNPLPLESNLYWEIIGNKEDLNNYFGEVEIGSYPSPSSSASKNFDGNSILYSYTDPLLYKYKVINDEYFKSGRYITFTSTNPIIQGNIYGNSNISYYQSNSFIPKFYKIKLYHQLNNGYLDLTNDVWTKFLTYKINNPLNTSNYWFYKSGNPDIDFLYYCPSQYKGKLVISLEIEDLKNFKLDNIPIFSLVTGTPNNSYSFNATVFAEPLSTSTDDGTVQIPKAKIEFYIDGIKQKITTNSSNTFSLSGTEDFGIIDIVSTKGSFVLGGMTKTNDSNTYENRILSYKITPILSILPSPTTYSDIDFPIEFINKYTISGSKRISTGYDDIVFVSVVSICEDGNTGYKINEEYILKDRAGNYLGLDLNISTTPYVFVLKDNSITTPFGILINNYTVDTITNNPVIYGTPNPNINSIILTMFKNEVARYYDNTCATPVYERVLAGLTFNMNCGVETNINVTYSDSSVENTVCNGNNYVFVQIKKNLGFTMIISRQGFKDIVITETNGLPIDSFYSLGLIAKIDVFSNTPGEYIKMYWNSGSELLSSDLTYRVLYDTSIHINYTLLYNPSTLMYENETIGTLGSVFINATILAAYTFTSTYYNIPDTTNYRKIDNIIFDLTV